MSTIRSVHIEEEKTDFEYYTVNRHGCLAKRGQRIPHPSSGANTFVAYFNVFSNSRKEALEIAAEVKKEVRYSIR